MRARAVADHQHLIEVVAAERMANGASNVMRNLSKVVVCPWMKD